MTNSRRTEVDAEVGDGETRSAELAPGFRPDGAPGTTVGTGSALGIGCLVAVVAFVLLALALRWLTGVW